MPGSQCKSACRWLAGPGVAQLDYPRLPQLLGLTGGLALIVRPQGEWRGEASCR